MNGASRWLGGALVVVAPFRMLGGCPGGENGGSGTGGTGGAAGDAAGDVADGDGAEPWDPVWHETKPKDWPTVGPEKNPDCGPGCRVALNLPVTNPSGAGHRYTTSRVASQSPLGLAFSGVGASTTAWDPSGKHLQVSMWGDFAAYVKAAGPGDGQIELMSLVTGEKKTVFRWTPADGADGSQWTALNDKYVFYIFKGIHSRNRQTGEQKWLAFGSCYSLLATETALICDSGKIYVIDPESSEMNMKRIDDGTELQFDGSGSADRKQYAWVDYRDPPGPGSHAFSTRKGGEVYFHDFTTGKTRRATFDSPDKPRAKVYPGIGDGLAVWNEPPLGAANPNPENFDSYYGGSTALATLDLATGKRCQLPDVNFGILFNKSVHGRHVYAGWFDKKTVKTYLVDIDLDYAGFKWQCQDTPGWVQ
ncbi:MAG: hypothetical protein IPI67_37335 [Myxococcales bacterium]|nr:hypothetical protein [Myxococcales bacterium]